MKHALGNDVDTPEGKAFISRQKGMVIMNNKLYLKVTPKGKASETLVFVVPRVHHHKAIDGYHWDCGHQGQNCTATLVIEHSWWPGMAAEGRNSLCNCNQCIKLEGEGGTAPLHLILASCPLKFINIDFATIKASEDSNLKDQPPLKILLVVTNHFTRHAMAFITKDQNAKTVAQVLYNQYFSIFGAPACMMSDLGANFTSNVIAELCTLLGLQHCRTTPYHPQSNRKVERFHQTLTRMIGKLNSEDMEAEEKANWPAHLPELIKVCNGTRLAIMGCSPHYLMFGRRPHFPIDMYFPTMQSGKETYLMHQYVATLQKRFHVALEEACHQNNLEASRQKWYYDHHAGVMCGNTLLTIRETETLMSNDM